MGCNRGRASPNGITIKMLFAASAGFCQNPNCTNNLFIDSGSKVIHVAEMAHIIAAEDNGPRADKGLAVRDSAGWKRVNSTRCEKIIYATSVHTQTLISR